MSRPRRRTRRRNRAEQAPKPVAKIAQPKLNVPPYDLVSEEKLQLIHDKSMQILEEAGIAFYYDEAIEILKAHGVKVVDSVAYFDRELVMAYIAKAPAQFTFSARNPEHDVIIGGAYEDQINFIKLAQMNPYLHSPNQRIGNGRLK